jgi:hypothetical protein
LGEEVAVLKVQRVILTIFTYSPPSFTCFHLEFGDARGQDTPRNLFVGWSDPTDHFGHGTVSKSGVAPAQHGVLPASKLSILSGANSSPWGTCSIAEVNARVTDRVICVFHAPVTLPRCRKRLRLFEIVKPSTIKEALKNGKVRKNF